MSLDNVYICHWSKLKERKQEILISLEKQKIKKYNFIETFDKDNWNKKLLEQKYAYAFKKTPLGRNLNDSEISLLLKHHFIISELAQGTELCALVLEDDVVFCDDFLCNLKKCLTQVPSDWDLIWVGTCCNLHTPSVSGKYVYLKNKSRCTHCYMISKKAAIKILNNIDIVTEAIDHAYNHYIEKLDLNSYWLEPALAIQNPNYKTTIQKKI